MDNNKLLLILIAGLIGIIVSNILGPILIPVLHKLKFGQNIREDGPRSHLKKAGTPTIGGLIFIISTTIAALVVCSKDTKAMVVLFSFLAFAFVGFLDDILKIIHKQNLGLKAWQKMVLLFVVTLGLSYYAYVNIGEDVLIPFINKEVSYGWIFIPFLMFYFLAFTNAVNLTDGLDGLCSSVTILVTAFLSIASYRAGLFYISAFGVALIGSLIGFLRFNAYPAKVFMGDTGSLALGGAIAAMAMFMKSEWLLVIVGFIYVIEAASVVLQVGYFKLTKGKRLFKMAPIHHHFEQLGWSEVKIVSIFCIITVILCLIGLISL